MKKNKIALVTVISTLLFVSISCEKKVGQVEEETPSGTTTSGTGNVCDTVTYSKHIKPIMDADCISCHKTGVENGNTNLETYELVKLKGEQGRIKARVIDGIPSYMPQDKGKLPKSKLDLINCWLNNGMKP